MIQSWYFIEHERTLTWKVEAAESAFMFVEVIWTSYFRMLPPKSDWSDRNLKELMPTLVLKVSALFKEAARVDAAALRVYFNTYPPQLTPF